MIKNVKGIKTLTREELKFILSGVAPDCEDPILHTGYECRDEVNSTDNPNNLPTMSDLGLDCNAV